LIEESIIGWKEYEMEVVRDRNDNCIIVCAIENVDPMGVHTGDSITVAPTQTLTDKEYQRMRNASIAVLREIGVETGGSNVQFGLCPKSGRLVVIEMNPRVSRSSALASKATGFPIAKIAAKLAVGYTLDELKNEITGGATPASFEPSIDYVVTKIPRFNFEKFPQASSRLTTQMKSVGEVMAIGRTFKESVQKALRGLEIGISGFDPKVNAEDPNVYDLLRSEISIPGPERLRYIADAFRLGYSLAEVKQWSQMDPWFLTQIEALMLTEAEMARTAWGDITAEKMFAWKRDGFSDHRISAILKVSEQSVRELRNRFNIHPVYKRVDTCAGEFATQTAYLYSTYERFCEAKPTDKEKIMVLGGGPNRIGQGIEFDYCCVHAALAIRECGYEAIMVNCNPETVSTDYNISDRLYFEPLTLEDVLEIVRIEKPKGVVVQYGGQTPLKLAKALEEAGVSIIGTSPDAIDCAEDRERFSALLRELGLKQPANCTVRTVAQGLEKAQDIGYPLVVRPSYVLGGRAMEIVYNDAELKFYLENAVQLGHDSPVLLDRFLDDAVEVDVDAVCDGKDVMICGIMEHIEQAGIHSGDSACTLPPHQLSESVQKALRDSMTRMSKALNVIGLVNAQFAIQRDEIYVLEVNPRASRTVPFVAKATGVPLAKIGVRCMLGIPLSKQSDARMPKLDYFAVKAPVFPFDKFQNVDPILGPEMKSTGEVMGVGPTFAQAYAKAQLAIGQDLNPGGKAFISVRDADKPGAINLAAQLIQLGFELVATRGTADTLRAAGVPCETVKKVAEGRPHVVDMIKNGEIEFIVNTTEGKQAIADSFAIRRSALQSKIKYTTTLAGGFAAASAFACDKQWQVVPLQILHNR
jgi:carbamoyl-phosphate synthase large subunit